MQAWEDGVALPTPERLQALIRALLDAGALTPAQESREAREMWTAVEQEAPRMRIPFDEEWFATLLGPHGPASSLRTDSPVESPYSAASRPAARAEDWGEIPDTTGFVGRATELELLQRWLLDDRCRVVALLGMGGIGKTSLAARVAQKVAPSFERIYWRSLRNAPPFGEWLAGAVAFVSDQQLVLPPAESERITALLRYCEPGDACWCSTILRRCSSRGNATAAIEQAWTVTGGYCRPSEKLRTRAA